MKNIIALIVIIAGVMLIITLFSYNPEIVSQSYAIANDGKYIPVYKVQVPAMRMENVVEVEWNGKIYSAYLDTNSEIETGNIITCTFALYEGEYEFIGIE